MKESSCCLFLPLQFTEELFINTFLKPKAENDIRVMKQQPKKLVAVKIT